MSTREAEMRDKLRRLEGEIIFLKRTQKDALRGGATSPPYEAELSDLKQSAGRIRKHLSEGIYV